MGFPIEKMSKKSIESSLLKLVYNYITIKMGQINLQQSLKNLNIYFTGWMFNKNGGMAYSAELDLTALEQS